MTQHRPLRTFGRLLARGRRLIRNPMVVRDRLRAARWRPEVSVPLDADRVLDGRRVLSLDVFDTCLARRVLDPSDVFGAVAVRRPAVVQRALGRADRVTAEDFRELRRRAEADARRQSESAEVTLEEIVRQLVTGDDSELVRLLVEAELEVERMLAVPIDHVRRLASEADRRGLAVVYVSDMYLSSVQIRALLDHCGFPRGEIFVSSEHGCAKGNGELFRLMLGSVAVEPNQVVHIGDNPLTDVEGARRVGVSSILLPTWRATIRDRRELFPVGSSLSLSDSLVLGLAVRGSGHLGSYDIDRADARSIGRHALGPTMVRFASWIQEECADESPILFCSRDALDLSTAWIELGGDAQRSRYFKVSRRSIGVPALAGGFDEATRDLLCGGRRPLSARQLFTRVGLDQQVLERCSQAVGGVDVDVFRADGPERDEVWDMFLAAQPDVVQRARRELDLFGRYWTSLGLSDHRDVWLVDVGWRGTVQRSLQRCLDLCGFETRVHGRYLALMVPYSPPTGSAAGLLVNQGQPHLMRSRIEAGIPIVERLFQAGHGTVVRYLEDGVELGSPPRSSPLETTRRCALDLIREVRDTAQSLGLDALTPTDEVVRPMLRVLNQPRSSEVEFFSIVEHSSDLVDDNVEEIVARPDGPISPRSLVSELRASEWRPGVIASRTSSPQVRRIGADVLVAVKQARYWVTRMGG